MMSIRRNNTLRDEIFWRVFSDVCLVIPYVFASSDWFLGLSQAKSDQSRSIADVFADLRQELQ